MTESAFRILYFIISLLIILYSYTDVTVKISGVSQKHRKILALILFSLVLAIFASIRPLESHDTTEYYSVFMKVGSPHEYIGSLFKIGHREYNMETGFILLIAIVKSFSIDFRGFLFIVAFINSILINVALIFITMDDDKENKLKHIFAIFMAFFGLHYCCIAIRSGLSIGLCLLSYYFINNKKYIWSVICILIASRVQNTALLFIAVLLIVVVENKRHLSSVGFNFLGIYLFVCLCSLMFNIGSVLIDSVISFTENIFDKYNLNP